VDSSCLHWPTNCSRILLLLLLLLFGSTATALAAEQFNKVQFNYIFSTLVSLSKFIDAFRVILSSFVHHLVIDA
jgi:hypothetical protein